MKITKALILACITTTLLMSCNQQTETKETVLLGANSIEKAKAFPIMSFTETEFDFGTITEGDTVEHTFSFTNTGNAPLVIVNAKGSCGCTVSKWPKEPIAPGVTKELLVVFNSNGKPNAQNKQVTITANTNQGKEILKIKAMVTPKAKSLAKSAAVSK